MKNKLFTLAAALTLAAVIGSVYAAPAVAAGIKAVLVRNVDEPGRSPFQDSISSALVSCPSVPTDKRLVVEYIGGRASHSSTLTSLTIRIGDTDFSQPLTFQGVESGNNIYHFGGPTRAYLDHGQTCDTLLSSPGGPSGFFRTIVFSGYLVDLNL